MFIKGGIGPDEMELEGVAVPEMAPTAYVD